MKSDPPITQRRSPRQHTVQGGGGPKIRPDPQPQTSNPTRQTGSRKRKLVLDNDEGDDDKSGDKGSPNKFPKRTMPKKKLAGRQMPKIRTSSRKPSDIDPTGKDPNPAVTEPNLSKDAEPTAENQPTAESQPTGAHALGDKADPSDRPPTGDQSATAETATTQEPPTGNQSDVGPDEEIPEVEAQTTTSQGPEAGKDSMIGSLNKEQGSPHVQPGTSSGTLGDDEEAIPRIKAADDSRPPILLKWWDENSQVAGIVINRQKEDEEVCQLKKALGEATLRDQLHEAKEYAKKTEKELRDRIAQLQDSNFELSGSSKAQATRMAQMEKQIEALKRDKVELAAQRDSALKEVEDGTSEEAALDLISNAQSAADKIASDVVEQFRNNDLQPSDNNSDGERTDSD
ncbi:golgin candidate 1-like [Oryza sativa Japonica Group]|uniref:golgin candidate 1-like n=1 Tax=Oryza sativa subsp. japonica TaxID=39947 RepID=UPI00339D0DE8